MESVNNFITLLSNELKAPLEFIGLESYSYYISIGLICIILLILIKLSIPQVLNGH